VNSLCFIDDGAHNGCLNMAIDDLLAQGDYFCKKRAIFRTYMWERATLSYGDHQKVDTRVNRAECNNFGVALARRPTGGRELLHDGDLSFSLVGPVDSDKALSANKGFFLKVARVIVGALGGLGITAEIKAGAAKGIEGRNMPCLAVTSEYEIVSGGKKLIPMAQRVYPDAILVHGSIPLRDATVPTAKLLISSDPDKLQGIIDKTSTNLNQLLGHEVDLAKLKRELAISFEREFDGEAIRQSWPAEFLNQARESIPRWS
jgi:lipoate-protein ligase A